MKGLIRTMPGTYYLCRKGFYFFISLSEYFIRANVTNGYMISILYSIYTNHMYAIPVSLPESMFPIHAQYKQHFNTTALSVCVREKTYHSSLFI